MNKYLANDLNIAKKDILFENNEFILENDITITPENLIKMIQFNKEEMIDTAAHYASTGCNLYSPIRANLVLKEIVTMMTRLTR